MKRQISNERQLGAFIHDARVQAGMTQADLALRAGVSRKWLIGLEQGARTRAELGKVFDTLQALGLSMRFSSSPEVESQGDATEDQLSYPSTAANISPSTLDAVRRAQVPSAAAFASLRDAMAPNKAAMDVIRGAHVPSAAALESTRGVMASNKTAMDAIRGAQVPSTAALESLRSVIAQNQATKNMMRSDGISKSTADESSETVIPSADGSAE